MASHTKSDDEALAGRLSLLSPHDFDDATAPPVLEGSLSANHPSRQRTPPSDEEDDLGLALRLSQLSDDDFDKLVSHHFKGYPPRGEARPTTPPVEDNECDLELALTSSQLPADLFDEQAMEELNRRKEGRPSVEGTLA
jgi:hypothetical protein